jgi:cystathionine gamma-synthase
MTEYKQGIALGRPIPDNTPHAVSVSLPTWRDVVGYEEGDRRVIDAMQTGYPRFFLNKNIQKVRTQFNFGEFLF